MTRGRQPAVQVAVPRRALMGGTVVCQGSLLSLRNGVWQRDDWRDGDAALSRKRAGGSVEIGHSRQGTDVITKPLPNTRENLQPRSTTESGLLLVTAELMCPWRFPSDHLEGNQRTDDRDAACMAPIPPVPPDATPSNAVVRWQLSAETPRVVCMRREVSSVFPPLAPRQLRPSEASCCGANPVFRPIALIPKGPQLTGAWRATERPARPA